MFKPLLAALLVFQATSPLGCGEVEHTVGDPPTGEWTLLGSPLSLHLTEVSSVSATEAYVLGGDHQFFRYDGTDLNEMHFVPFGNHIEGVVAQGPGTFTAVGADSDTSDRREANFRFANNRFADEGNLRAPLLGAAATPNGEVIAVGGFSTGAAYRRGPEGWVELSLPSSYPLFSEVTVSPSGAAYLLHSQGLLKLEGEGGEDVPMFSPTFRMSSVFATTGEVLFVGGPDGMLATRKDGQWTVTDLDASTWNAIWGRAANDVWAVGNGGSIAHFNGQAWTLFESPTHENLHALSGTADGQLIAVGDNGTAITYQP